MEAPISLLVGHFGGDFVKAADCVDDCAEVIGVKPRPPLFLIGNSSIGSLNIVSL